MFTSDFDFNLPDDLIAQSPTEPRDHSRLMIMHRDTKQVEHRRFFDIVDYFKPGDVVVRNNSKVFKARLFGTPLIDTVVVTAPRESSEVVLPIKRIEIFLVRPMQNRGVWKVLAKPAKKLRLGMKLQFAEDFWCEVLTKELDGTLLVQFPEDEALVRSKANRYGEVPLPPYVRKSGVRSPESKVGERYQTVYAKHEGSVAAPTAGFHFTPELIEKLQSKGVEFVDVTLHVGLGTFLPVKSDRIEDHTMHSEWVELTPDAVAAINHAKADGRRVVAVGTTSVRVLEGVARAQAAQNSLSDSVYKPLEPFIGDINIFITPGFRFRVVDALITNFHLPKSTLLMLVSAFAGDTGFVLGGYREAVAQKYRFYSFGDATLLV
jgi:S-adenosylmethionine:tRNA ribosyltransferase-isomerase